MGQAEDLARVDIPLFILGDIGSELDKKQRTYGPLEWPSSTLQWIVLWAWSRTPDNIEWTRKGMEAIWSNSKELSARFTTRVPIFQPNEAGVRLARMSAAVAARLFSTSDGHKLVIDEEHVVAARHLYERFLGAKELGITELRSQELRITESGDVNGIEFKDYLRNTPPSIRQIMASGFIPSNGFGPSDAGGNLFNKMTGMHAITFQGDHWEVSPWASAIAREIDG